MAGSMTSDAGVLLLGDIESNIGIINTVGILSLAYDFVRILKRPPVKVTPLLSTGEGPL